MPSRPPRRLVRQIGPDAAQALFETRGTGRRFSAYRDMLAGLVKAAYLAGEFASENVDGKKQPDGTYKGGKSLNTKNPTERDLALVRSALTDARQKAARTLRPQHKKAATPTSPSAYGSMHPLPPPPLPFTPLR